MSYLERCIKESLRLFPSVPTVARHLMEDLQLSNFYLRESELNDMSYRILNFKTTFRKFPDSQRDGYSYAFYRRT